MKANNKHTKRDLEQSVEAGSQIGEPAFIAVGKFRRPHGVSGDILLELLADVSENFDEGKRILVGEKREEIQILSIRPSHQGLIVTLKGFSDPETVGRLRNQFVYIPTEELPHLPEGEFYLYQLLGLSVFHQSGEKIGVLKEVIKTGAKDVYVIETEASGELLIPAIESVIIDINIDEKRMIINPQEWY